MAMMNMSGLARLLVCKNTSIEAQFIHGERKKQIEKSPPLFVRSSQGYNQVTGRKGLTLSSIPNVCVRSQQHPLCTKHVILWKGDDECERSVTWQGNLLAFSSILRHSLYTSVISLTSAFCWSETETLANMQRPLLRETGDEDKDSAHTTGLCDMYLYIDALPFITKYCR
nr:hypothetical protein [Tanacetum cinerariifolium]